MVGFLFSVLCYVAGLSSLVVFFAYIHFFIDQTSASFSWIAAVQNLVVFLLFPLQHSVLARPAVKKSIRRFTGELLERPLYVGTSGVVMFLVLWLWKPLGTVLYRLPYAPAFEVLEYFCVLLLIVTTNQMGHSSMFGLSQGYAAWKRTKLVEQELKTTGIFGVVRHPLTLLLIVILWAHNTMTAGRLELNVLFTAYALLGTVFEERDLIKHYGDKYLEYKRRVPAFIPLLNLQHR